MMKKILLSACSMLLVLASLAQTERQTYDTTGTNYRSLISVDRVKLLSNVDVIANMQFALNNRWQGGEYDGSNFAMNQFRLEIKGKVHEKVYFRFRDRYTRLPDPQSVDNLSRSTDLAFIRIDATPKWSFSFGKLCADWGGYEFDLNPIDIYEYNDIVEYADNFLMGIQASYRMNKQHEFTFQLLNSRTKTFEELYDTIPGVTESKFPVAAVFNWRGSMFGGKWTTIWSYSHFLEAKNKSMRYLALGNQFNLGKTTLTYDFKWSDEDIDRKTIVTEMVPKNIYPYAAEDVTYVEHWLQVKTHINPKWSLSCVGMVSDAYWRGNPDPRPEKDNHLRTAWGLIPSVEYYPFKNLNLYFFGSYVWRSYQYTDYAELGGQLQDYNRSRFMIGFISPLLVL
jgi:hypothetical protein